MKRDYKIHIVSIEIQQNWTISSLGISIKGYNIHKASDSKSYKPVHLDTSKMTAVVNCCIDILLTLTSMYLNPPSYEMRQAYVW
jgi:hypothetical protein